MQIMVLFPSKFDSRFEADDLLFVFELNTTPEDAGTDWT